MFRKKDGASTINKKNTLVSATAISAVGLILTRIISVVYIIPFASMVEGDAMRINTYANAMFGQFYELSLAGLPLAISRLIAMYNAREEYKTSNRILRYGQIMMLTLGVILGVGFFLFATPFALSKDNPNIAADLIRTMQIIAPSLVILPFMSGMRGYLQGFKTVLGTSISQVIERLVFVIVLLVTLYLGIYHFKFSSTAAISYAYIAQPLASLAALFVLLPFYRGIRKEHKALMEQEGPNPEYDKKDLIQKIIMTALPFVIAGFASTMYMGITTFAYEKVRIWSGAAPELAGMEYVAVSFYTNKLVSIPLTFSLAMSTSIISFVTASFESGNFKDVRLYVRRSYRMIIFTTLSAVVLMVVLGKPLLTFFYGYSEDTNYINSILAFDGFRGMFFALETITIAILQSLGQRNKAVIYTATGPVVKLILTVPLVYFFGIYGEVISVIIGLGVVVTLATRLIADITKINPKIVLTTVIKTLICLAPAVIFLFATNFIADTFFPTIFFGKITSFIYAAVTGLTSLAILVVVAEFTGFLQIVFGAEFSISKLIKRFR